MGSYSWKLEVNGRSTEIFCHLNIGSSGIPFLLLCYLILWNIAKDRKVIPDPIDDRKFYHQLNKRYEFGGWWSVVNLSFSFRTPSTSSYLLVGVKEREDRRRQKTTNRGNKFSRLVSVFFCFLLLVSLSSNAFILTVGYRKYNAIIFSQPSEGVTRSSSPETKTRLATANNGWAVAES